MAQYEHEHIPITSLIWEKTPLESYRRESSKLQIYLFNRAITFAKASCRSASIEALFNSF